jgi:UDP-N-acetylglucosamine 1-carboxyvinyltransferase
MDAFIIHGGKPLSGTVSISGAKNAALPQMAAALLTSSPIRLENVPRLQDINSMVQLLEHLGARIRRIGDDTLEICADDIATFEAPYDLVRKMRASIVVLGPLLGRFGEARVSLPGGCAIGARPVDLHIAAMKRLGSAIELEQGYVIARARNGLRGKEVIFEKVTVTGTENAMMAAVLAEGRTTLNNAAMEPEVVDLGKMLKSMGAQIDGLGTPIIVIEGVKELGGTAHHIIHDRIETGTYLSAGLITCGDIRVRGCKPEYLKATLDKLLECGAALDIKETQIHCMPSELHAVDVRTAPYPGFATDMQAQFAALMTQAQGRSAVHETIFENRFMHVPELSRMGADIRIEGHTAIVTGRTALTGASVMATDLRASASLVLAGLVARGRTTVNRVYHIDRGYSGIVSKLKSLGADIERVSA